MTSQRTRFGSDCACSHNFGHLPMGLNCTFVAVFCTPRARAGEALPQGRREPQGPAGAEAMVGAAYAFAHVHS